MRRILTLLVTGAIVATTAGAPAHGTQRDSASPAASASARESTSQEVAYGAGSVFGTLVYAPLKTSFCVVGAVTSGLTLPFGGTDTAGKVATAACAGTWVITPGTLKGKEPIRFIGQ